MPVSPNADAVSPANPESFGHARSKCRPDPRPLYLVAALTAAVGTAVAPAEPAPHLAPEPRSDVTAHLPANAVSHTAAIDNSIVSSHEHSDTRAFVHSDSGALADANA